MIHEGPLLEYAGRDLAYLHWVAAARHWLDPRARRRAVPAPPARLRAAASRRSPAVCSCSACGSRVTETAQAKMRILRVPALLGLGVPRRARRGGVVDRRWRRMSGALVAAILALGLGVIVVRRRSAAIALIAAQSLALGIGALGLASGRSSDFLVASLVLLAKAAVLARAAARRDAPHARAAARRARRARTGAPRGSGRRRVRRGCARAAARARRRADRARPPSRSCSSASRSSSRGAPRSCRCSGLIVAENGLSLLAVSVPGGLSYVVELGALFDLALVVTVAVAFTQRIHGELGTGDTELLRGLRD